MRLVSRLTLVLVLAVFPVQGRAAPLPHAPEGFSWVAVDDINALFLRPEGWYFTYNKGKLRGSLVISHEPPDINFRFETGFTCYTVNNLGKVNGRLVSEQIGEYVHNLGDHEAHDILSTAPVTRAAYTGASIRFRDNSNAKRIIHHRLYLANDRTDTLLIINFESPEAIWSETWLIGEVLVRDFVLDASRTSVPAPEKW